MAIRIFCFCSSSRSLRSSICRVCCSNELVQRERALIERSLAPSLGLRWRGLGILFSAAAERGGPERLAVTGRLLRLRTFFRVVMEISGAPDP